MMIARRGGWVLIGVVIGALATGSTGAVKERLRQEPPSRLVVVSSVNFWAANVSLIKDTKSAGCWLAMVNGNSGASLATAPAEACR